MNIVATGFSARKTRMVLEGLIRTRKGYRRFVMSVTEYLRNAQSEKKHLNNVKIKLKLKK
jgi:hypothetical protein